MPWFECLSCGNTYFFPYGYLTRDEDKILARAECKVCGNKGAKRQVVK